MADAHLGYGMPIGGVMATQEVVIPNAVGVDIGCGMCAVRTSLTGIDRETLLRIMAGIRARIPLGFAHHKKKQNERWMPDYPGEPMPVVEAEYASALKQVGTLGGGNHFIEVQQGSDGHVWLMIHSGSRNIGFKVARHYNRLAGELNRKWKSPVPPDWQLAYLPLDSRQGQVYLQEMRYCVDFALANRLLMMERFQEAVMYAVGKAVAFGEVINIAHNYAAIEKHFGVEVVVHRKGATQARAGQTGIVPGSQGTTSYIVRGRGNPESFESCSHGAGRKMGRKQAQRELNLEKEKSRLDKMGVIHALRGKRDLDEAAGAYKDIAEVMANQADLVTVEIKLKPLAVVKG
ncbi:MAG: RtcB family protein [Desulfobacterales bacterium]|nr:RtcB family protein [Desulfobacterales bacterium]